MTTITMNDDYTLSCDTNIIPAQYSSNIPFKFEVPEEYKDAIVVPGYIYYDGDRKIESAVSDYNNGQFSITNGFIKDGILGISFALTNGDITETTTIIEFEVRRSVNTSFSLPSFDIWQDMLKNFMDQYMGKVYSSVIEELIEETKTLQSNTTDLQTKVNESIKKVNDLVDTVNKKLSDGDFTLDFKFEGTKLFIKKHTEEDWGEGVELVGPTAVKLDTVVQNTITLAKTRTAKPTHVKVQIKDSAGKPLAVETTLDNVYIKSKDGTTEKNAEDLFASLYTLTENGVYYGNVSATFTELDKFF